jgi:hypothetical protein
MWSAPCVNYRLHTLTVRMLFGSEKVFFNLQYDASIYDRVMIITTSMIQVIGFTQENKISLRTGLKFTRYVKV